MSAEPPLVEGEVDAELARGVAGAAAGVDDVRVRARARARPSCASGCALLSDRFRGPQAIALRRQPIPHAYRVFFRHIGLEPDEHRIPVEALALERMQHGGFRSRNLLDDAITIAVMETSVPVWALDAAALDGRPAPARRRGGRGDRPPGGSSWPTRRARSRCCSATSRRAPG